MQDSARGQAFEKRSRTLAAVRSNALVITVSTLSVSALAISWIGLDALSAAFASLAIAPACLLGVSIWKRRREAARALAEAAERAANASAHEDAVVAAITKHDCKSSVGIVGVIRFNNYDAMAAFNPAAAERVLAAYAKRLQAAVGPMAAVSRLDANCHAIWLSGEDISDAKERLSALARVMAQEIVDEDVTVLPDIHIGAAQHDTPDEPAHTLLARARASAIVLNRFSSIQLSSATTKAVLADRFAVEQALRKAVQNRELHLHYQPFVDTRSGRVVGAEALLRWRHPKMGDVSPATFVPLLEETGLVHEIGLWTLNTACRQLTDWRRGGERGDFRLAVNLSAIQLQNPALKSLIERTVASHGLSADSIEIELTETAAMEDPQRTRKLFQELRALGFGIAIDDFGNGFSNLNYLKDLPFTKLKIDREFVTHADKLANSRAICKALVELGAGLGISVLAEGAERSAEVRTLEQLGCTLFQGFFFSRALSPADLTALLDDRQWLAGLKSNNVPNDTASQKRIAS